MKEISSFYISFRDHITDTKETGIPGQNNSESKGDNRLHATRNQPSEEPAPKCG